MSGRAARTAEPAVVEGVTITHPDRVVDGEEGLTKLELARYYERIARRMLPHLADRPLSMKVRLMSRYGTSWEDLRADRPAGGARCRLLVVHDGGDSAVPVRDGMAVVEGWDDALLVLTSGMGHHKILREPSVVSEVMRFLADTERSEGVPATRA